MAPAVQQRSNTWEASLVGEAFMIPAEVWALHGDESCVHWARVNAGTHWCQQPEPPLPAAGRGQAPPSGTVLVLESIRVLAAQQGRQTARGVVPTRTRRAGTWPAAAGGSGTCLGLLVCRVTAAHVARTSTVSSTPAGRLLAHCNGQWVMGNGLLSPVTVRGTVRPEQLPLPPYTHTLRGVRPVRPKARPLQGTPLASRVPRVSCACARARRLP